MSDSSISLTENPRFMYLVKKLRKVDYSLNWHMKKTVKREAERKKLTDELGWITRQFHPEGITVEIEEMSLEIKLERKYLKDVPELMWRLGKYFLQVFTPVISWSGNRGVHQKLQTQGLLREDGLIENTTKASMLFRFPDLPRTKSKTGKGVETEDETEE